MKNKIILIICLVILCCGQLAWSWEINTEPEVGEAGEAAAYLKTGVGPRALSMGSAFIAVADDSSAAYWNPAGIAFIKENQLGLVYSKMSLDRTYNFANVTLSRWHLGISAIMSGVEDIEGYDIYDNPTGTFEESNIAGLVSYAPLLTEDLSLGFNLKLLQDKIKDTSSTGYGFDAGLLAKLSEKLNFALMLQDVYTTIAWKGSYKEWVPLVAKTGVSYDIFAPGTKDFNIKLAADIEKYSTRKRPIFNFGTEVSLLRNFAIRTGIADNYLTAGFGIKTKLMGIDYCYKADKMKSGDTNQIALNILWGRKGN